MDRKALIEVFAGLVMILGLLGIFALRWRQERGIGRRAIQLATVILVVPVTLVLAIEGILNSQTVAAILGGIVGYGVGQSGARERSE